MFCLKRNAYALSLLTFLLLWIVTPSLFAISPFDHSDLDAVLKEYVSADGLVNFKVLKDNPAVGWYEKCGFRIVKDLEDYYQMELDLSKFVPCSYRKIQRSQP